MEFFNSREAIASIIGDIVDFYSSKNLNCIGVLSSFKNLFSHFHDFLKSNGSSDFGHSETGSGAKKRVVLRREIFHSNFKVE